MYDNDMIICNTLIFLLIIYYIYKYSTINYTLFVIITITKNAHLDNR